LTNHLAKHDLVTRGNQIKYVVQNMLFEFYVVPLALKQAIFQFQGLEVLSLSLSLLEMNIFTQASLTATHSSCHQWKI